MTLKLRPKQVEFVKDISNGLKRHQAVIARAPCGFGKTAVAAYIAKAYANADKNILFVAHQRELITQTAKAFYKFGVPHGIAMSGVRQVNQHVMLGMVQSLIKRLGSIPPPALIIMDEGHRSTSVMYVTLRKAFPHAKILCLTATPKRTDGRGFSDLYQLMLHGPENDELIADGLLSNYILYGEDSSEVDTSKFKKGAGGDYRKEHTEKAVDKKFIGNLVDTYRKRIYGKRTVVMAPSVAKAYEIAEEYNAAGIPAACIEGSMTDAERRDVLERFRRGIIWVLTNVQLLIEGVDIPAIEAIQWARFTMSLIVWTQANGRTMRPFEGKDIAYIIDHCSNWKKLGTPRTVWEWTLDAEEKGAAKRKTAAPTIKCPKCFRVFETKEAVDRKCPGCGEPIPLPKPRDANVKVVDKELVEITETIIKLEKRHEEARARTLAELVHLGVERGYPNPSRWATFKHTARQGRKPEPRDFKAAADILAEIRIA